MERKKVWVNKHSQDFLDVIYFDYEEGREYCQDTALTLTRSWIIEDLKNREIIYRLQPPITELQKRINIGIPLSPEEISTFEALLKKSPFKTREEARTAIESTS